MSLGPSPTKLEIYHEAEEIIKNGGSLSSLLKNGRIHNEAYSKDKKIILSWDEYLNNERIKNVVYQNNET